MATNSGSLARSATGGNHATLGDAFLRGEYMIAIGCGGLLLVLVACAVVSWYAMSAWSTDTDTATPAGTVQLRRGEIERSSLDSCPAAMTKFYTRNGMVCR